MYKCTRVQDLLIPNPPIKTLYPFLKKIKSLELFFLERPNTLFMFKSFDSVNHLQQKIHFNIPSISQFRTNTRQSFMVHKVISSVFHLCLTNPTDKQPPYSSLIISALKDLQYQNSYSLKNQPTSQQTKKPFYILTHLQMVVKKYVSLDKMK